MERMARKGNAASAAVRRAASAKRNEDLLPVIDIRGAGLSTPQQIADGLNERGITAARGGTWSAVQVRRILKSSTGQKAEAQRAARNEAIEPHMDGTDRVYSAASEMRADGCALVY